MEITGYGAYMANNKEKLDILWARMRAAYDSYGRKNIVIPMYEPKSQVFLICCP